MTPLSVSSFSALALFLIPCLGFSTKLQATELSTAVCQRLKQIFEEKKNAVVRVTAEDSHGEIIGSGFYADSKGTIYTLAAIVKGAEGITVSQGEKKLPARLLTIDPRTGIALLKVESETPFIRAGDSSKLPVASLLMSIGYPLDKPVAPSFGMLYGFDRKYQNFFFRTTHLRTNVPVQKGQGGAPVLNLEGEAVGIVVSSLDGGTGCYVLPIRAAEKLRIDYERFGEPHPGWIGAKVEPSEDSRARIVELESGTPAFEAGLQENDILVQLGEFPILSPEDVIDASFYLTVDDPTPVVVIRNGQRIDLVVRPAPHPEMLPSKYLPQDALTLQVLNPSLKLTD